MIKNKRDKMFQTYYDAADKLSELAKEFDKDDEAYKLLKKASLKVSNMASNHGAIKKVASSNESPVENSE